MFRALPSFFPTRRMYTRHCTECSNHWDAESPPSEDAGRTPLRHLGSWRVGWPARYARERLPARAPVVAEETCTSEAAVPRPPLCVRAVQDSSRKVDTHYSHRHWLRMPAG